MPRTAAARYARLVPVAAVTFGLCLAGCGWLPTPPPPTRTPAPIGSPVARPATPPRWEAAVAMDPARIAADPSAWRGANVILRGVATDARPAGGATLFAFHARRPNLLTVPLAVELVPPADVADGGCCAVYGVVAGGGARPALVYGYLIAPRDDCR